MQLSGVKIKHGTSAITPINCVGADLEEKADPSLTLGVY